MWVSEQAIQTDCSLRKGTAISATFYGKQTGFYDSGSSGTVSRDQKEGRWQPWNPVAEIIMRPIGKPVGLIVCSWGRLGREDLGSRSTISFFH